MKTRIINKIKSNMKLYLDENQLVILDETLRNIFKDYKIIKNESDFTLNESKENSILLMNFLASKHVEGCSQRTIIYYNSTIEKMLNMINKKIEFITTEDLRKYLADYRKINGASKNTVDNIRRVLSSFFSWLEDEDYILKNPVRRIHKIKTKKVVKEVLSDDVLFNERECIVLGKGDSERIVYFDAKTKIHLQKYLESRKDKNSALFVSFKKPYNRLGINGVERRIRELGHDANIKKVHPHKFRRTMATNAIDKGMPIEQVQKLLGHVQIDTTMQYAMVNQSNVKIAHRKFIG